MRTAPKRPLLVLLGGVLLACGAPPNVLFISIDTLRADHLSCYGYERPTSPEIDALAERGVVFENALSTSSWTLPAHASMLTGRYPAFHALQDDGVKLPPEVPTVAEAFRTVGYHTLAVTSHVYVSSEFGLERGFDVFDDSLIEGGAVNPIAEQVVERFTELMQDAREPFFAFVHFFDPHWEYTAPAPYHARFADPEYTGPIDGTLNTMGQYFYLARPMPEADRRQLVAYYDGEIAYVDAWIGRMLRALERAGRLENTVIVLTSDHGEEFKEHGRLGHARTLFGEQLRVPLVIAGHPSFAPGSRRSETVSLVDLAPTMLALIGADRSNGGPGRPLHGDARDERPLFAETIRFGLEQRAVQRDGYKLIHRLWDDRPEFYDLERDRGEEQPLRNDPTSGGLSGALADYAARADRGWHVKLLAPPRSWIGVSARIHTPGRILRPRRYSSQNVAGSASEFLRFELDPEESTLLFLAWVSNLRTEVTFDTEPADAPVTFEVEVEGKPETPSLFLGRGVAAEDEPPFTLERSDPRLVGLPDYANARPGAYIRVVGAAAERAPKTDLSDEALERLRELGYLPDAEPER